MTYFKAKMHQIRFRLGLRPRPCWGAYSAPRPLAGFGGRFAAGEGLGWGRGGKEEGKGEGREREGPQVTVTVPLSLATPLTVSSIICDRWPILS